MFFECDVFCGSMARTIAWSTFIDKLKLYIRDQNDWDVHEAELIALREKIAEKRKTKSAFIQGNHLIDYLEKNHSDVGKIWLDFWKDEGLFHFVL